ncbi:MAG: threonine/serine exporter [Spirochaetales bacterium]|nr:MAG: threonine/serine exporter [Spirochaetales bacterium]
MDPNSILSLAADAGQIILENGGETYRVEETINHICSAFGMTVSDCFALPTGIMLSVVDREQKSYSLVRRITKRSIDLEKISRVNNLVRNLKPDERYNQIHKNLKRLDSARPYPAFLFIPAGGLCAACFTWLFGGSLREAAVAFAVGLILKLFTYLLGLIRFNHFFSNLTGAVLAAALALVSVRLGLAAKADMIIIGSIMLLVPGILIVNSIRDIMAGDLVAGVARLVEAFILAAAIAAGNAIVIALWVLMGKGSL